MPGNSNRSMMRKAKLIKYRKSDKLLQEQLLSQMSFSKESLKKVLLSEG